MSKNKSLNKRIQEIETEISKLENMTSIKKLVSKYNKIHTNIEKCRIVLKDIENSINNDTEDENISSSSEELENDQFLKNLNDLEEIKNKINNTENIDIEEMYNYYQKSKKIIKKCNQYLEEQKMEIVNID